MLGEKKSSVYFFRKELCQKKIATLLAPEMYVL
jgi:hypothetical protein